MQRARRPLSQCYGQDARCPSTARRGRRAPPGGRKCEDDDLMEVATEGQAMWKGLGYRPVLDGRAADGFGVAAARGEREL